MFWPILFWRTIHIEICPWALVDMKQIDCLSQYERTTEGEKENEMIEPIGTNLFVEPVKRPDTTAGGIYLPDSTKKKPEEGIVVAVGPGKLRDCGMVEHCPMKVGDRVLFGKWASNEVTIDGKDLYQLTVDQVYAILRD